MTVCDAALSDDVRLFHSGPDGIYGNFSAVETQLDANGQKLGFAMNAGMYHPDRAPVGLYIEDGKEISPIVTRDGPGNFGLLPNGVFCIGDRFEVIESRRFDAERPGCRFATQSGPMLVIDGALHPDLLPASHFEHSEWRGRHRRWSARLFRHLKRAGELSPLCPVLSRCARAAQCAVL